MKVEDIDKAFTDNDAGITVEVMQFFRPNGMKSLCTTRLPICVKKHYKRMEKAGCRFEAEQVFDSISVTISDDEKDIDIRIVPNGPEVQRAMVEMLETHFSGGNS